MLVNGSNSAKQMIDNNKLDMKFLEITSEKDLIDICKLSLISAWQRSGLHGYFSHKEIVTI